MKLVAKIELYKEHQLGQKQRKRISAWLKYNAKAIEKEGANYDPKFKSSLYWL